jgi:perosamine synthetase
MNNIDMKQVNIYQDLVRTEFLSLKSISSFDESVNHSIPLADGKGHLKCVSELHANDESLISLLAKWRMETKTFHNKFNVTNESTKYWIRKLLLDVPDRILFLVVNRFGRPVGHMGFANVLNDQCMMEFDNVIRGVPKQDPGLMGMATKSLLIWANNRFKPNGFHLKTLDNNQHAINFYSKLGFEIDGKQPLRLIESNGEINHLPITKGDTNPPDRYFICMRLNPSSIIEFS